MTAKPNEQAKASTRSYTIQETQPDYPRIRTNQNSQSERTNW
jgi:hypothetical protein